MQYICDSGANLLVGSRWDDAESFRIKTSDGTDVGQMCGLGTFAEITTVDVRSTVKIDKSIPLEVACLVGCGVGTGWGTAVQAGEVKAGDTVIVMGVGGIGINAVQGAAHAGASHVIAVDPVRLQAREGDGARRDRRPTRASRRPPTSPAASPTGRARTRRWSPSA